MARHPDSAGSLGTFSAATRAWFSGVFEGPTPAQAQAWAAIGKGDDTLVIAPTGSGKTLAAFLWALDRLAAAPPPAIRAPVPGPVRLTAQGAGHRHRAEPPRPADRNPARGAESGLAEPDIHVAVRTGDTAADERRKLASKPPDVLITTPESLFLLLTSKARETLRSVETVIVDEVHALAGNKRGAHLAVPWSAWTRCGWPRSGRTPRAARRSGSGCRRRSGRSRRSRAFSVAPGRSRWCSRRARSGAS